MCEGEGGREGRREGGREGERRGREMGPSEGAGKSTSDFATHTKNSPKTCSALEFAVCAHSLILCTNATKTN